MTDTPRQSRLRVLLRFTRRSLFILAVVMGYGVQYAGRRMAGLIGGGPGRDAVRGHCLAGLFEALGPTFIKIGQILSTRPDLLPAAIIAPLTRLQDQVRPFAAHRIPAIIEQAFGRPMETVFARFDPEPLSSASVAQVHRAWLPGGEAVAVKLRRPGITETVRDDLLILRSTAKVLQRLPGLRLVPFVGFIEAFGGAVERQLDFRLEAANNRRFRHNFRDVDAVRFPRLVEPLCTDAVLTMSYFDGLRKVEALDLGVEERHEAVSIGLRALYQMIFTDGFIHGDLHPANVFFVPGPAVVILDLGLVAELNGADLDEFVEFFLGLAENNGRVCARIIYDGASYLADGADRATFEAAMITLIDRHASLNAEDFEVTRFATDLFDVQRRCGVRGPTKFTMTIVALLVYEGMVKHLYPDLDFQREAVQYIVEARTRRLAARAEQAA